MILDLLHFVRLDTDQMLNNSHRRQSHSKTEKSISARLLAFIPVYSLAHQYHYNLYAIPPHLSIFTHSLLVVVFVRNLSTRDRCK